MWTTYINDMQFDYILLERGHAPVAATSVADYLASPRENSEYLLTADVYTGGEPYIERARAVKNYSAEEQRACIVTSCDLPGNLGNAARRACRLYPKSLFPACLPRACIRLR